MTDHNTPVPEVVRGSDRPIIFSGPMVRALLEGRKTQTRRLATSPLRRCQSGDRLWVRESIRVWPEPASDDCEVTYPADNAHWATGPCSHGMLDSALDGYFRLIDKAREIGKAVVRPSIHMPRWASRLTLIVEAVRIEPLQAISEQDAIAEGVERPGVGAPFWKSYRPDPAMPVLDPRESYAGLWSSLHGADSWDGNPEVLVLTFRVERGNIDRIGA